MRSPDALMKYHRVVRPVDGAVVDAVVTACGRTITAPEYVAEGLLGESQLCATCAGRKRFAADADKRWCRVARRVKVGGVL